MDSETSQDGICKKCHGTRFRKEILEDGTVGWFCDSCMLKEEEQAIANAKNCYRQIIDLVNYYMDLPPEMAKLVALWSVGTYLYREFPTYPILYLNAIKGAGKSRLESFLSNVCWNGIQLNNVTEAVLFRSAGKHTMIIDEIENIMKKEKGSVRELINSAYKRGAIVERMKKVKINGEEKFVIEKFDMYCPIALANINGMHEVTADRCIPLVLEKSINPAKVKLIEDFSINPIVQEVKVLLTKNQCSLCRCNYTKNLLKQWNNYISLKYHNYITTYITLTTLNTQTALEEENVQLFERIDKLEINGRNLELFFPLIVLASMIDNEALKDILEIAHNFVNQKIKYELADSPDIALYRFCSDKNSLTWYRITEFTKEFKEYYLSDEENREWLNVHWVGKALRRLALVSQDRRRAGGMEVLLNIPKAQEKVKMFDSMLQEESK